MKGLSFLDSKWWMETWLGHRRQPAVVIALAVVLVLPALWAPLITDDYIHRIRMTPTLHVQGFEYAPLDLFVFSSGDPEQRRQLMEAGGFAWWTAAGFKMAFWRPLSVATHVLDHYLWERSAVLMHAHSIVWFAVLLAVMAALYRRFHPPWVAGLALMLYAFDDARGMVLSFVANRNALIAAVFAVGALIVHDRWRRDGWRPGSAVAPALFGLGLLAGESALGITAYLFAYALFIDRGTRFQRLLRLIPYALVALVWAATYRGLGYGTHASGIYLHPADEPVRFLGALVVRLPVLLLGQIAGPFADFWLLYPAPVAAAVYVAALLTLAVGAAVLWPLLRRSAVTRFWTLGAVTAGVPICATFPSDRLLVFVGIGAMGAMASLLALTIDSEMPPGSVRRVTTWIVAGSLAFLHLIVAPLLLPLRSLTVAQLAPVVEGAARSLPNTDELRDKILVVVSAPSDGLVAYAPMLRAAQGLPWPKHLRLLATGVCEMRVTRLDAFTLRVQPAAGFYGSEIERMVRGLSEPMASGYRVTLSDMQVTVTAVTDDGRAAEAEFRFALPLEDPSLLWTRWEGGALVAYDPPQPGQTQIIPAGDLAAALLNYSAARH